MYIFTILYLPEGLMGITRRLRRRAEAEKLDE